MNNKVCIAPDCPLISEHDQIQVNDDYYPPGASQKLPDMLHERWMPGATMWNGCLTVVGGENAEGVVSTVEICDEVAGVWEELPPLAFRPECPHCCCRWGPYDGGWRFCGLPTAVHMGSGCGSGPVRSRGRVLETLRTKQGLCLCHLGRCQDMRRWAEWGCT